MSLVTVLLLMWAASAVALGGLFIYRSMLGIHEQNQIFLDPAERALQHETLEIAQKIDRITPIIKGVGIVSIALFLLTAAMWVYQGLYGTPAL